MTKTKWILVSTAIVLLVMSSPCYAEWAMTHGGSSGDHAYCIRQAEDGGYIVAGCTRSFGAGNCDTWVLKLNSDRTVAWEKTYGLSSEDYAYSIQPTQDGGYIVAGHTRSFGAGSADIWVLNLDSDGEVIWQKTYGGSSDDYASSIQQTEDGAYIVAGYTDSFGAGSHDLWVLKLNSDGTVAWQKTYGTSGDEVASSIQQTQEGGYIVAGTHIGDAWILKLHSDGTIAWQKTYGTSGDAQAARCVQQTEDGGYILACNTHSLAEDHWDFWILKLDSNGNVIWQKTYGGSSSDSGRALQETSDGGYVVAGYTRSFGAGNYDIWVLKVDSDGEVVCQKTYGGSSDDYAYSIQQTLDYGYILAGYTSSFGEGSWDLWVLKLDVCGEIPGCTAMGSSEAAISDTSLVGYDTSVIPQGSSAVPADTPVSSQDAIAETSVVCHFSIDFTVKQEIVYGGWLDKTQDGVLTDTLITVTHGNRHPLPVKIVVYDKYGSQVAETSLVNGGQPLENNTVPVKGLGWITLGMTVNRVTHNPLGSPGGEAFSFKIATGKSDANLKPTFVEVKQVVYHTRQRNPGEAIWNPTNIAGWSGTALGGKRGTGLVKYPSSWDQ